MGGHSHPVGLYVLFAALSLATIYVLFRLISLALKREKVEDIRAQRERLALRKEQEEEQEREFSKPESWTAPSEPKKRHNDGKGKND